MQPKVRAALEASIKHWEGNVAAKSPIDVTLGPSNCPLCDLFRKRTGVSEFTCKHPRYGRCLVWRKTGKEMCADSPYEEADRAFLKWEFLTQLGNKRLWRAAARTELDFLRSLRED